MEKGGEVEKRVKRVKRGRGEVKRGVKEGMACFAT
jgi:hypothetical protein